jgi:hypothetical protein
MIKILGAVVKNLYLIEKRQEIFFLDRFEVPACRLLQQWA